jgi:hypothetical protein
MIATIRHRVTPRRTHQLRATAFWSRRRHSWRRLWFLTLAFAAACDVRPPATPDPYDPTAMNFKSPPARITNARQTGAFAAGAALSMTAALKALDPAPVKEIRLDTTHKIIEIAPGVRFTGLDLR